MATILSRPAYGGLSHDSLFSVPPENELTYIALHKNVKSYFAVRKVIQIQGIALRICKPFAF
jgi:hypothetical protein